MGAKIVIVDDEPHIRQVILLKLKTAGYDVEPATNAADGIALATRVLPDLVISDFRMPGGLTGVDLIRALRKDPGTQSTPLILLTGSVALLNKLNSELKDVQKLSLMSKPFSPRQLLAKVEEILGPMAERKAS